MTLKEEIEKTVEQVAAEYSYALALQGELEILEKEPTSKTRKELHKAFRLLRWIGKAERRVAASELSIIKELNQLSSEQATRILKQLKVVEAKLVRAASLYLGDLRQELQDIETYEELEQKYKHDEIKLHSVEHKLSSLIQNTKKEVQELIHWIQATEEVLKEAKTIPDPGRRSFLKRMGALAAGAAIASYAKPLLAAERFFSSEEKMNAILPACTFMEEFFEGQMRKTGEKILLTPHADYTHFNRVGEWKHSMIQVKQWPEVGSYSYDFLELMREKARVAFQPTDEKVSILERSLITLIDMKGRSKLAFSENRLLVAKHFPGGGPDLELTEREPVVLENGYDHQAYMLPFRYLLRQGLTKAIMISHAAYPRLEGDYQKFYTKYELPVIKELASLGWTETHHAAWMKIRPATTSPTLVRGLLREELGFQGLVYADAVNMLGFTSRFHELTVLISAISKDIDEEINNENYIIKGVLIPILLIYAGVDILLLNRHGEYSYISKFASSHPYFRRCLEEAYERIKRQHKLFGWKMSHDSFGDATSNMVWAILNTKLINTWSDPWDRGGAIHQIFRRKYLAILYKDQSIFDDKQKFWEMHQKTDWAALDSLYKQVIEQRYI